LLLRRTAYHAGTLLYVSQGQVCAIYKRQLSPTPDGVGFRGLYLITYSGNLYFTSVDNLHWGKNPNMHWIRYEKLEVTRVAVAGPDSTGRCYQFYDQEGNVIPHGGKSCAYDHDPRSVGGYRLDKRQRLHGPGNRIIPCEKYPTELNIVLGFLYVMTTSSKLYVLRSGRLQLYCPQVSL
jgi:hypothetical protein